MMPAARFCTSLWITISTRGNGRRSLLGEPVTKYHKTLTTYLNGLLENGFELLHVAATAAARPHTFDRRNEGRELRRPMMLIVSARKK